MCVSLDLSSCPGIFTPFRANGFPLVCLGPILISESNALTVWSFSLFSIPRHSPLPHNFHMTCPSLKSFVNNPSNRQINFLSPPQTWSRSSHWGHVYNQEIDKPASLPPQCWYTPTKLYTVTTQNTKTWISRKCDWMHWSEFNWLGLGSNGRPLWNQ